MNLIMDTHVHSIGSGHAYSTIQEIAVSAKQNGLKLVCLTDHGPAFPGGPHSFYFRAIDAIPDTISDVRVVTGIEANITDYDGTIDIPEEIAKRLRFVIASLHEVCIKAGTREENTRALINAIKNPYVDGIGHPGEPCYSIDVEAVVQAAKEHHKLLEINNRYSVFSTAPENQYVEIARLCKEYGVMMMCGTDSHFSSLVGKFPNVQEMIHKLQLPEEIILNTSLGKIDAFLTAKAGRLGR